MTDICKDCGKKIIWGVTYEGKRIPLDPSAPIYMLVCIGQPSDGQERVISLMSATNERKEIGPWVSHFSICSQANTFSASRKGDVR